MRKCNFCIFILVDLLFCSFKTLDMDLLFCAVQTALNKYTPPPPHFLNVSREKTMSYNNKTLY